MPANRLHLNVSKKLLLLYTSILLASLLLVGQGLNALHNNLMDDRRQSLQHLVKNALSLVHHYQQQTQQGLSLEQAQQQALQAVRNLRYGERGYFWINDLDTRMLAHPIWPEMEGHLQKDYQDSNGQYIFRRFVALVKDQQAGFVHYYWPKPEDTQPIEKLSYVELYEPWGWVLGSGIYLDDMEKIFWQEARIYGLSFGALLIIISYLL
jgi:methyl-accepting chemotaxis protein